MKKILIVIGILVFTLSNTTFAQDTGRSKEDEKAREKAVLAREKAEFARQKEEQERIKVAESRARSEFFSQPSKERAFAYSTGDGVYVINGSGSSSSQLSLSKIFEGESKTNEGSFSVDESVRSINLNLSGSVKSGEISIKIKLENGDVIKDLTIDESADIQFSQSIRISDEETKYYGKWSYTIKASSAEGRYKLSISTR